jgi:hypothetical protein
MDLLETPLFLSSRHAFPLLPLAVPSSSLQAGLASRRLFLNISTMARVSLNSKSSGSSSNNRSRVGRGLDCRGSGEGLTFLAADGSSLRRRSTSFALAVLPVIQSNRAFIIADSPQANHSFYHGLWRCLGSQWGYAQALSPQPQARSWSRQQTSSLTERRN